MEKGKGELIGQGIAGLILGNTFEVTADDFEKNVRQFGSCVITPLWRYRAVLSCRCSDPRRKIFEF